MSHTEPMLLVDCVGYASLKLHEAATGKSHFQGKFQEFNAVNKNKRIYPESVLKRSVEALMEAMESRGLFGELDHPTDSVVHLANVSHIITKLWWEGSVLMGEGEILNTPSGRALKAITDAGARWGISSRGVGQGQVNSEGVLVIGESFKLITFDAVADPSTKQAFQKALRRESAEPAVTSKSFVGTGTDLTGFDPANVGFDKSTVNPKALASYFGCVLEHMLADAKSKIVV